MESERSRRTERSHGKRLMMLALGPALMIASPLVGLIPGPGGLIVFVAGLALTLQASHPAKRLYVRAKKRWPRIGHWSDKGLRRRSHFRRLRRAKDSSS